MPVTFDEVNFVAPTRLPISEKESVHGEKRARPTPNPLRAEKGAGFDTNLDRGPRNSVTRLTNF